MNSASNTQEDHDQEQAGIKRGPRSAADIQRSKLARLMKNPDKPVHIPTQRAEKNPNKAPDFVYNVMGSSAGAGSGEFHVYRQIRRKELLRQEQLSNRKEKDELNEAYHQKLAENEKISEEKTKKKREKRLKKKEKAKMMKLQKKQKNKQENKTDDEGSSSSNSDSDE